MKATGPSAPRRGALLVQDALPVQVAPPGRADLDGHRVLSLSRRAVTGVSRSPAAPSRSRHTGAMAYDVVLARRVRELVHGEPGLSEKKMFGGLAFLVGGNMAVSASSRGGLLLRVDPADTESLTSHPQVRRFEMRGREMDGWLRVDAGAVERDDELRTWVGIGLAYARSLPPK